MKNKKALKYAAHFLICSLFLSCSSLSVYDKVYPALVDGKYDSEFPYKSSSLQLEEISNCIKLINSIAFYTSYIFSESSRVLKKELNGLDYDKRAVQQVFFNRTASGTGTVISEDQGSVAVLTVAHIISFPDTIISYFVNPDGTFSQFVQSISIKTKQTNYIPDFPNTGVVQIVLLDKALDIAILGNKYPQNLTINLPVFNYPWGNSTELEWGSFVYVFGFPMNYKMISKGIVSSPGKEKNTFLIDAVFNRGYSGGIVLAVRDGVPNFELVGIVRSVPADYQLSIRPLTKEHDIDFNPMIPYSGEVYVDKEQVLRTGITKVIGIESVKDLLIKNKEELINKGYFFKDIFSSPSQLRLIRTR